MLEFGENYCFNVFCHFSCHFAKCRYFLFNGLHSKYWIAFNWNVLNNKVAILCIIFFQNSKSQIRKYFAVESSINDVTQFSWFFLSHLSSLSLLLWRPYSVAINVNLILCKEKKMLRTITPWYKFYKAIRICRYFHLKLLRFKEKNIPALIKKYIF